MQQHGTATLKPEQRREVAAWFAQHKQELPDAVRIFLELHQTYLATDGNPRQHFDTAWRELRRALGITPSSEKRPSGSLLAALPRATLAAAKLKSKREKLQDQLTRAHMLGGWHRQLKQRHLRHAKRLEEKLAAMPQQQPHPTASGLDDMPRLEDIELTQQEMDESDAYGRVFVSHLTQGNGLDPALQSVNETLIPGGAVLTNHEAVRVDAEIPAELDEASVVKDLSEQRVRYDFAVTVTRIELEVEKKVVVDGDGAGGVTMRLIVTPP